MAETAQGQMADGVDQNGVGEKQLSKTSAIWNSSSKEFIGRTWDSWVKIAVFYLIFYSCLAAFFAVLMVGFFQTIDPKRPTQMDMQSLLKSNPGMGFRPMPEVLSTLIEVKQGNKKNYSVYTDSLADYMKDYHSQTGDNLRNCSRDTDGMKMAMKGEVCRVGTKIFGDECTEENEFSYDEGTPCIALKINKIFGWLPIPFNKSDFDDTNNTKAQEAKRRLGDRFSPDHIGVSCEGENDADLDNIGPMRFFPEKGFPTYFFPFVNQENYKPPLVFVKFDSPANGVVIQIWCKLWTANIRHHKNDKAGSIHFELLVD